MSCHQQSDGEEGLRLDSNIKVTHNLEVVFVVQDYIKRMRSAEHIEDFRLELGEITNEFKTIATRRKVPIVTATQVNKSAIGRLEEYCQSQANVARNMSLNDIGESGLIAENMDCVISGYLEKDSNGDRYLGFKRLKLRDQDFEPGQEDITYFAQPFERLAGMRLVEDIHDTTPAGKLDLSDGLAGGTDGSSNTGRRTSNTKVTYTRNRDAERAVDMADDNDDEEDDLPLDKAS